jgi:hypothetical protein
LAGGCYLRGRVRLHARDGGAADGLGCGHHWQAILRMERATRQLLKGFELVTDRQDDPE